MSPRLSYDEIYLEADEEVTTAIEKVKKSDQAAVALILPRNAVLGQSIVNLKLVYKEAAAEDKEVALVSPDPTTRNLAERVGFTAYPNLKAVSFAIPPLPKATTAPVTKPAMGRKPTPPAEQKVAPSLTQRQASEEAPAFAAAGFVSQPVEADEEAIAAERGESKASAGELTREPASPSPSGSPQEGEIAPPTPPVTASGMIPTRGNLRFFRAQKRRAAVFPMTVALILILLGLAGIALYWPAAHLTIQVKAQPFQETVKSTVDTEGGGG